MFCISNISLHIADPANLKIMSLPNEQEGVQSQEGAKKRQPIKIITRKRRKRPRGGFVGAASASASLSVSMSTHSAELSSIRHADRVRNISSTRSDGIPTIFTSSHHHIPSNDGTNASVPNGTQVGKSGVKKGRDNEAQQDEMELLEMGIDVDSIELPSDIILAIRSLLQRHSYATCPLITSASAITQQILEPVKFVLKPMINQVLHTSSVNVNANCRISVSKSESKNIMNSEQRASAAASTGFHEEIHQLCLSNQIKLLQLQGLDGEEDEAVLEMNDYVRAVESVLSDLKLKLVHNVKGNEGNVGKGDGDGNWSAAKRLNHNQGQGQDQDHKVVDLFLSYLKESINATSTSIANTMDRSSSTIGNVTLFQNTHVLLRDLERALRRQNRKNEDADYLLSSQAKWIDTLVHHQLLLPRNLGLSTGGTGSASFLKHATFWFTIPRLGQAASTIAEGRRRMVNRLKRAPNREMKRKRLETTASKDGMMGPFHVRDLIARDVVKLKITANGQFLKLVG